jgi:hypothetical protein
MVRLKRADRSRNPILPRMQPRPRAEAAHPLYGLARALIRFVTARWKRLAVLFGGVLAPLFTFGELADDMWRGGAFPWDAGWRSGALNQGAKMLFQRAHPDLWLSPAPAHKERRGSPRGTETQRSARRCHPVLLRTPLHPVPCVHS